MCSNSVLNFCYSFLYLGFDLYLDIKNNRGGVIPSIGQCITIRNTCSKRKSAAEAVAAKEALAALMVVDENVNPNAGWVSTGPTDKKKSASITKQPLSSACGHSLGEVNTITPCPTQKVARAPTQRPFGT